MNKDAKEFRSKYFFMPRKATLPQREVEMMKKKQNEICETIEKRKKMINSDDKESEENQR